MLGRKKHKSVCVHELHRAESNSADKRAKRPTHSTRREKKKQNRLEHGKLEIARHFFLRSALAVHFCIHRKVWCMQLFTCVDDEYENVVRTREKSASQWGAERINKFDVIIGAVRDGSNDHRNKGHMFHRPENCAEGEKKNCIPGDTKVTETEERLEKKAARVFGQSSRNQ